MNDIVPDMLKSMRSSYSSLMKMSPKVRLIRKEIESGMGTWELLYDYAEESSRNLSKVLLGSLNVEMLPEGRLYFNIADRVIRTMLKIAVDDIAYMFTKVMEAQNKSTNLGIKPVKPVLNEDRIQGIIEKLLQYDKEFR